MKKLFLIIASIFTLSIIGLLISTNFIFIKSTVTTKNPESINIYKNSTSSLNSKSYKEKDSEYKEIISKVSNLGNISIFDRLISGSSLDDKIIQSKDDEYSDNITDIKKANVCIEYIFESKQDKIIFIDGNSKVINFNKLLFVIPTNSGVNDIIIYYASDKGYESYNPLVMRGKSDSLINFINNI